MIFNMNDEFLEKVRRVQVFGSKVAAEISQECVVTGSDKKPSSHVRDSWDCCSYGGTGDSGVAI
ncbi:hypothetical protein QQP08_006750 [Theobroma cacao]|nr:hypothetical protein QQP08_006750 [Theobroma cacao]